VQRAQNQHRLFKRVLAKGDFWIQAETLSLQRAPTGIHRLLGQELESVKPWLKRDSLARDLQGDWVKNLIVTCWS
jgi:hypothetical protein